MEVRLALHLPRDAVSVPLTRRILLAALTSLGVTEDCRADIQLAVAEACGNVIRHAGPTEEYAVSVFFDAEQCTIEVVDKGPGLPPGRLRTDGRPGPTDESGRGLHLIRHLADRFDLTSSQAGTVLRFVKRLTWAPDAAIHRLPSQLP
ncbi:MAG TPA: ATP-binding protein [Rugosimonospora sp.]|nr:ATP-binding protein [Rugosimonospora sp.]